MRLVGIIPARAGSKGIKNKNRVQLAGKPLIQYTIDAALESHCIDEIVVTSDDPEILLLAEKSNIVGLSRPEELATDSARSDDVIAHVLKSRGLGSKDYFVLLQPTSPLRTGIQIADAWKLFQKNLPEMLVSVMKLEGDVQKSFVTDEKGFLRGVLSEDAPFQRRQDLPDIYLPNGAIYICSVEAFLKNSRLPRRGLSPYLMDESSSVDIDTLEDLVQAEEIINKKK